MENPVAGCSSWKATVYLLSVKIFMYTSKYIYNFRLVRKSEARASSHCKIKNEKIYAKFQCKLGIKFQLINHSKKGSKYFCCKSCRNDYIGGITEITRHENYVKHIISAKSMAKQRSILEVLQEP